MAAKKKKAYSSWKKAIKADTKRRLRDAYFFSPHRGTKGRVRFLKKVGGSSTKVTWKGDN